MKVSDIMSREIETVAAEATIEGAAQMMAELDVEVLPVQERDESVPDDLVVVDDQQSQGSFVLHVASGPIRVGRGPSDSSHVSQVARPPNTRLGSAS